MSEQPISRLDRVQRIAWLEALAGVAGEQAAGERAELQNEAAREAAGGCVPSWRLRDLGTVSGREATDRVVISDPGKFLAWVLERHPEQVEQVVRKAYADLMRKSTKPSGNPDAPGEVVDNAGEVVPGLEWQAGGRFLGIAVTLEDGAKQVFNLAASLALTAALRAEGSPFAADMADAAEAADLIEGAALLADETQGADEVPAA